MKYSQVNIKSLSKHENKSGILFQINVNNKDIRVTSDHLLLLFIDGKEEIMTAEKLYEIKKDKAIMFPNEYGKLEQFEFIKKIENDRDVYNIEFNEIYGVCTNGIVTI